MTARTRALSRSTRARDERGSVLVMVLVLVIVLGVICAAILPAQQTGSQVQTVIQGVQSVDVSADSLMLQAIAKLRDDSSGKEGRDEINPGVVCDDKNNLTTNNLVTDATAGLRVACAPLNHSGLGGTSTPYASALMSLGGQSGKGSFGNHKDPTSAFCDDYAGGTACEPGILVGRGATSYNNYGMLIATPDKTSTTPLVRSNSSIVINQQNMAAGTNRFLQIEGNGGLWARRGCTPYAGQLLGTNDWFQLKYVPKLEQPQGGPTTATWYDWAPPSGLKHPDLYSSQASDPYKCWLNHPCALTDGSCYAAEMNPTGDGSTGAWNLLPMPMQDPVDDFHHELWDATTAQNPAVAAGDANNCVPNIYGEVKWYYGCGDFTSYAGTGPQLTPASDKTALTPAASPYTGNNKPLGKPVTLPPLSDCAQGYVAFQPGYYNDGDALNKFLSDDRCHESVLHFTPGIYYFDFNGPYQLGGPGGNTNGKPQDTPGIDEQLWMIGGAPPDGTLPGLPQWIPCPLVNNADPQSGRNCNGVQQPWKSLEPNSLDVTPNTKDANQQGWDESPPDLAEMAHIDTVNEVAQMKKTSISPNLTWSQFDYPIQEQTNGLSCTTYGADCYRARHLHPVAQVAYDFPVGGIWNHHEISFSGAKVGGTCTVMLPDGHFGATNPLLIDLSQGCPHWGYQGVDVNSMPASPALCNTAPRPAACVSLDGNWWNVTGSFPNNGCAPVAPSTQCAIAWDPMKFNTLQGQAKFQLTSATSQLQSVAVDGMKLWVTWDGPPSPTFPAGCQGNVNGGNGGVQFIFGGKTQWVFNNSSLLNAGQNEGAWVDVCSSPSFNRSSYGPVVIGLTDHGGYAKDGSADQRWLDGVPGANYGIKPDGLTTDTNPARDVNGNVIPAREAVCCGSTAQPWGTDPDPTIDPTAWPGGALANNLVTFAQPLGPTDQSSFLSMFDNVGEGTNPVPNPNRPQWVKDLQDPAKTPGAALNTPKSGTQLNERMVWEAINKANDGKYLDNYNFCPAGPPCWTDGQYQSMIFNLPMNVIPQNSFIERVEIRMRYAQQGLSKIKLILSPAQTNGGVGTQWTTEDRPGSSYPSDTDYAIAGDGRNTIPLGTNANGSDVDPRRGDVGDINKWLDWDYGRQLLPVDCNPWFPGDTMQKCTPDSDPTGNNFRDANAYTRRSLNPNWPNERALSDEGSMGTAAALFGDPSTGSTQGAKVTLTVTPQNGVPNPGFRLDMLSFHVVYRPPGTLRPLRGCVTTRPARAWQVDSGGAPFSGVKDDGTNTLSSYLQVGTDRDWAADSAASGLVPDDSYYFNNAGQNDTSGCALLTMNGPHFETDGSVYAPTAAIDLVGNDNDAAFVQNSVVVRQYTATKWKNGFETPAIGNPNPTLRDDRHVVLTEYDSNNKIRAQVVITIFDMGGRTFGANVRRDSWVKQPGAG